MQGKILDYNNEFKSGLIRGEDGSKYRFSIDDCKSDIKPKSNAEVDFEPSGDKAIEVYIMTKDTLDDVKGLMNAAAASTTVQSSKNTIKKIIYAILGIVIFILIGSAINGFYTYYKEHKTVEQLSSLVSEGDSLQKSGDFQNAIMKYQSARDLDPHSNITYSSTGWKYDYKIAESYIGMHEPGKALSLVGNPASFRQSGEFTKYTHAKPSDYTNTIYYSTVDEMSRSRKAWMCKIASKAYLIQGDQFTAQVYAYGACENGDCSLVEK